MHAWPVRVATGEIDETMPSRLAVCLLLSFDSMLPTAAKLLPPPDQTQALQRDTGPESGTERQEHDELAGHTCRYSAMSLETSIGIAVTGKLGESDTCGRASHELSL